jgi:3'(2'), 5'-bisphosphate nucleotidase
MHDLRQEFKVALRLAEQAGEAIMGFYQTGLPVVHKSGFEPITAADQAADDLICDGLRAAFPEDGLLSEESADDLSRLEKERVWIVDPLDGTTEFVSETGEFVVQIALAMRGQPVLGMIYQPATQQLYYSVRGWCAYHIDAGHVTRLAVSSRADPASMRLVASRSHFSPFIESARRVLGIASVEQVGSVGLKVGMVARGARDLYLATTVSREWDMCAPDAVLREAGGLLTNLCGERLVYNKPDVIACRGLIASNGQAHDRIVAALAPFLDMAYG